ncbi:MAG: ROK family transcriptional regulator [Lachnospiraceae bacterium]|nr:ROK family transcriptional regulator [Lachnospiraceae bacterium]
MANQKTDQNPLKIYNTNLVLNVLKEMKTATRGQLAQKTGLSQPTVNTIMQELSDKGIVSQGSFAASAGGRRPQCYSLETNHLRAVTIRVLRHSLEYRVMTADQTVILRNAWTLTDDMSTLKGLQMLLQSLLKQDNNIRVVSLGVPGVVGSGGVLQAIPQIPDLEGVALAHVLQEQFEIPVYVENDVNLVALGSVDTGAGSTFSDIVFVHIGKGVGAGIVIGGRIIRGFSHFAGEISYMVDPYAGHMCGEIFESHLFQTECITEQAQLISGMMVNIICLLNPPAIFFGSNLASAEMLWHVRRECEKHLPLWTLPSFQLIEDLNVAYDKGLLALVYDALTQSQ